MKIYKSLFKGGAAILLSAMAFSSCEDLNDWPVDNSCSALFRPIAFELQKAYATEVELRYNKVVSASSYMFEFSIGDSLFNGPVQKIEILADTLTPFADNTAATKVEYRTLFSGLTNESDYFVRMKAIGTGGSIESKYTSAVGFTTLAEQIFIESATIANFNEITVNWNQASEVSHITIAQPLADDDSQPIVYDLSPENISEGSFIIPELEEGTDYVITIYNGEVKRGRISIRTKGISGGVTYMVTPEDDGNSVVEHIREFISDKKRNITLAFEPGSSYTIASFSIPDGVDNIIFTGISDDMGNKPEVIIHSIKIGTAGSTLKTVKFENLNIDGIDNTHLISQNVAIAGFESLTFQDCIAKNFNRGLVYINVDNFEAQQILVNNCVVINHGTYGVVNISKSSSIVNECVISNSTFIDLKTHFYDVRSATNLIVRNVTLYNNTTAQMDRIIRSDDGDNKPLSLIVEKVILAGANNGKKVGLTYKTATNNAILDRVSFAGSYYTSSDWMFDQSITFYPNISAFAGTAADLFVDPDNGDFSIKPGIGFAGEGVAGDPRWW